MALRAQLRAPWRRSQAQCRPPLAGGDGRRRWRTHELREAEEPLPVQRAAAGAQQREPTGRGGRPRQQRRHGVPAATACCPLAARRGGKQGSCQRQPPPGRRRADAQQHGFRLRRRQQLAVVQTPVRVAVDCPARCSGEQHTSQATRAVRWCAFAGGRSRVHSRSDAAWAGADRRLGAHRCAAWRRRGRRTRPFPPRDAPPAAALALALGQWRRARSVWYYTLTELGDFVLTQRSADPTHDIVRKFENLRAGEGWRPQWRSDQGEERILGQRPAALLVVELKEQAEPPLALQLAWAAAAAARALATPAAGKARAWHGHGAHRRRCRRPCLGRAQARDSRCGRRRRRRTRRRAARPGAGSAPTPAAQRLTASALSRLGTLGESHTARARPPARVRSPHARHAVIAEQSNQAERAC
eukprot:SAG11_NODE_4837_length_1749_cov_14.340000_2_plen_414_part_00